MRLEDAKSAPHHMDSLPEQHIDSLPKDAWEDAYWKVSAVCFLRGGKKLREEEVAKNAGFDSVEDMYFRLKRWGLSGLVPLEEVNAVREGKAPEGEAPGKKGGARQDNSGRKNRCRLRRGR